MFLTQSLSVRPVRFHSQAHVPTRPHWPRPNPFFRLRLDPRSPNLRPQQTPRRGSRPNPFFLLQVRSRSSPRSHCRRPASLLSPSSIRGCRCRRSLRQCCYQASAASPAASQGEAELCGRAKVCRCVVRFRGSGSSPLPSFPLSPVDGFRLSRYLPLRVADPCPSSTLVIPPQAAGDLGFLTGDRIELVERTGSVEDWWTGKLDGRQGVFPGNYVQEA
jgi:hypothetical protein